MKYLLNSAVIVEPGHYVYQWISQEQARDWLINNEFESCIGYEETAKAIAELLGIPKPAVSRSMVRSMNVGDEALVFRLTIRLNDPAIKGKLTIQFIKENCEIGLLKRIG